MEYSSTDINKFLPTYPFIKNDDFYKEIYHKKEFYNEKLKPYEPKPGLQLFPYNLYSHQRLISKFMSSYTPNNKILLLHEMGCLDPDTPVLTWSGDIKLAKNITREDKLVGDDGKPRTILETKKGISSMYVVTQKGASSYTVNEDHILTIKIEDVRPTFTFNEVSNTWTLKWFDVGRMCFKTKTSNDLKYLENYAINIQPITDTFDISIKDFISLHSETKKKAYGFKNQTCIDWEYKETSKDPYEYGLWYRSNKDYSNQSKIPQEFLINSMKVRQDLLKGISDPISGIITNTNALSSIQFLISSLGLNYRYEMGVLIPETNNSIKSRISVECISIGEYVGWMVDGNGRYLLGDFTVTHNSGKSCSAVAIAEQIKSENSDINGVIYIAPQRIINNFILELGLNCAPGTYFNPSNRGKMSEKEMVIEIKKKAKPYYKFYTFTDFSNEIDNINKGLITKVLNTVEAFSNKVIIIDEVHNLREDAKKYNNIKNVCRQAINTKIILMSGTPMRDRPDEIASVMNLLTTKDIPVGESFVKEFLNSSGDNVYTVKQNKIVELKDLFKGKISYISSMESFAKKKFLGNMKLTSFTLESDVMSNYQLAAYKKAYEIDVAKKVDINTIIENNDQDDEKSQAFYLNSRQASLFVYPNPNTNEVGLYGDEGFKKYFQESDNKKGYIMKDTLKKYLVGNSVRETIEKISHFSSKYANVLTKIVEDKENRCTFIYCDKVKGGGAILLAKLFELIGFSEANGSETTKAKRYAIFTSLTSDKILKVTNRFNSVDNCFGEYIKVIIGSAIVSEGFSLKHIRQEHIITPSWNYTPTVQAIARGVRVGSHDVLLREIGNAEDININIYQHASLVPTSDKTPSIDYRMYKTAENKDISIKRIERIMKESAVDCALAYNRNYKPQAGDGSRECDYDVCEYKCEGISDDELKNGVKDIDIDYSTYQLYYSVYTKEITEKIKKLFQINFKLSLKEILQNLPSKKYTNFEIISVLRNIIDENIKITNKYGFISFLREEDDIYFLVDSLSSNNNFLSSYYTENPIIKADTDFVTLTDIIYYNDENLNLLTNLLIKKNESQVHDSLKSLPMKVQELLLEVYVSTIMLEGGNRLTEEHNKLGNIILKFYNNYLFELQPGLYVSNLLMNSMKMLRCVMDNEWMDAPLDIRERYFEYLKEKEDDFDKRAERIGVRGIYHKQTDEFFIRDLRFDKSAKRTGMNCMTWKAPSLVRLMIDLGVDVDTNAIYFKKPIKDLIDIVKAGIGNKVLDVFQNEDIDSVDEDKIRRACYWLIGVKDRDKLCEAMKAWMISNDLVEFTDKKKTHEKITKPIVEPVGEQTKKKRGRPRKQ